MKHEENKTQENEKNFWEGSLELSFMLNYPESDVTSEEMELKLKRKKSELDCENTYSPAWVWQSAGERSGCRSSCSGPAPSGQREAGPNFRPTWLYATAMLSCGSDATPQVSCSGKGYGQKSGAQGRK